MTVRQRPTEIKVLTRLEVLVGIVYWAFGAIIAELTALLTQDIATTAFGTLISTVLGGIIAFFAVWGIVSFALAY